MGGPGPPKRVLSSLRLARRLLLPAAAWLLLLAAFAAALCRRAPLLVNLGAGDEAFARGFRAEWERDGLRGSGETQFRWTLDGARLLLPLALHTPSATLRLRLARFTDTAVDVTLLQGEQVVAQWRQAPRGWRVLEVPLGALDGPLLLRFRSHSEGGDEMGLALDWVEVAGVRGLRPDRATALGLLALLLGVPLLVGLACGRAAPGLWCAAALAALATAAVTLDRLGGLLALARAGPPLLGIALLLGLASAALARAWPEAGGPWPFPALVPLALAALALVALSQPFFYYPDVDTHARFVQALGRQPSLLADPRPYQEATGAWTREVGGQRLAFPYSPVFHLLALPLAALLGAPAAIKVLGVLCAATSVLLVHPLARGLGLGPRGALLAQLILAALPVTASRLTLALYPTLLGQALELLLLVFLAGALGHLAAPRTALVAGALLFAAQLAYTGSVINVAALALVLVTLLLAAGEARAARTLLAVWAGALALVVLVLYARFVPVLFTRVLPHLRDVPAEGGGGTPLAALPLRALLRLHVFYDVVFPLLAVLGLHALRAAPAAARRVLHAALVAALALLALRFAVPALLRDAKEVELLAAPVAVCAAAALAALYRRGPAARGASVLLALFAAAWCGWRAAAFYLERFTAVGR